MILQGGSDQIDTDQLLSPPGEPNNSIPVNRESVIYKNLSDRYILWEKKDVGHQYFNMYAARLEKIRPIIESKAMKKWGNVDFKRLHELKEGTGRCIIIGTLYKHQVLKPSILKEISTEESLVPQPVLEKFIGSDDHIILEDELQRIQLVGEIEIPQLVTGVICAALGSDEGVAGKFEVEELCFAGLPEPSARNLPKEDKFVLITSGLELSDTVDKLLPLELLVDYVTGQLGHQGEQASIAKIVRVIVAGNSITSAKGESKKINKVQQVKEMDSILAQIASVCPVDVMPGEYDPANHLMPQQPFHRCMFPMSSSYSTMQSVTNPYQCELHGRTIIGTSGQNLKDIISCSSFDDPIDILEKLCDWGHLAPTAPDTLKSYPFYNKEPFSIDICPDIFFAGNQKSFEMKLITDKFERDILLVSVPKFSETGTCVLLNLRTLQCQPIVFDYDDVIMSAASSPAAEK